MRYFVIASNDAMSAVKADSVDITTDGVLVINANKRISMYSSMHWRKVHEIDEQAFIDITTEDIILESDEGMH